MKILNDTQHALLRAFPPPDAAQTLSVLDDSGENGHLAAFLQMSGQMSVDQAAHRAFGHQWRVAAHDQAVAGITLDYRGR